MTVFNQLSGEKFRKMVNTNKLLYLKRYAVAVISLLFFFSCKNKHSEKATENQSVVETSYISTKVAYAKGFSLSYHKGYKHLKIFNPFAENPDTLQYVLLPKGAKVPSSFQDQAVTVVRIPIQKLVTLSSSHIAMVDFLGLSDRIVGISNKQYVYNQKVFDKASKNQLIEAGSGTQLNYESIIASGAELVMTVGMNEGSYNAHPVLNNVGVVALPNAEWQEDTLLGRAEWLKLIAALTNTEKLANKKFDDIVRQWTEISQKASVSQSSPTLITGTPYKDAWFVPGGKSYMADLFKAANTNYHWADDSSSGSLRLDFEAVFPIAVEAEYWVGTGTFSRKQDLLGLDNRFSHFSAIKSGKVFNNNKLLASNGANAYWETGVVTPHLILADLIKIFHPEQMEDYELTYFQQLD